MKCRSPHRERGLKLFAVEGLVKLASRSPHRDRGLKRRHDRRH